MNISKSMRASFNLVLAVFVVFFSISPHYGQFDELILKPTKDVQVWSHDPTGEIDRGTDRSDIVIYEWTYTGIPTTKYGLIEFDLSSFPVGTVIDSALISLYHDPSSIDPGHSKDAGSNEFYFYRITQPWEESIGWNATPNYSEENRIWVPESDYENQDYIDIDITQLVQDIVSEPNSNFGFLMKLRYTQFYRSLVFASSEHPDSTLHPKLRIKTRTENQIPDSPIQDCSEIIAWPNPSNDKVTISLNLELLQNNEITVSNSIGQIIQKLQAGNDEFEIDVSNYSDGYYYISIPCLKKKTIRIAVIRD